MNVTIAEIAKLAGVSKTTISRVLNGRPDVKPETREKIEQIIKEKGFLPNAFAIAMSSKVSSTIGIIIPYEENYILSNPFYAEVLRGISSYLNLRGYFQLLCYDIKTNYVDFYKQKRVDGFILLSPGETHKALAEMLREIKAPFTTTAKLPDDTNLNYVDVDNLYGAHLAMNHLIELGHAEIGYINGPLILASSRDRMRGYTEALSNNSLPFRSNYIKAGDTSIEGGYKAMSQYFMEKLLPTAIFAASDLMAIGAIQAIKEKGLQVPNDISIVGFDDIPLSKYVDPPLTTVKQPAFEKGRKAAEYLIDMIENKGEREPKLLDVELVVRNSTSKVKYA